MSDKSNGSMRMGRVAAVLGAAMLLGGVVASCGSSGATDAGTAPAMGTTTATATGTTSGAATSTTTTAVEETGSADAAKADSPGKKNGTLLESALAGGSPVVCEFTESGTDGKMYVQGEQSFRFEGASDNGPVQMVRDGGMLYMWEPGAGNGLSIDVSSQRDGQEVVSPSGLEDNALVNDLRCQNYSGGAAVFHAPGEVQFSPLEDMMDPAALEGIMNGNAGPGSGN